MYFPAFSFIQFLYFVRYIKLVKLPLEFSATSGLEDEEISKEQELINKIWQAV